MGLCVSWPVITPLRVEAKELKDFRARLTQCRGIAAQPSERSVARDEFQILIEYGKAEAQCIETTAQQPCMIILEHFRIGISVFRCHC
jgi:hypothetical protein